MGPSVCGCSRDPGRILAANRPLRPIHRQRGMPAHCTLHTAHCTLHAAHCTPSRCRIARLPCLARDADTLGGLHAAGGRASKRERASWPATHPSGRGRCMHGQDDGEVACQPRAEDACTSLTTQRPPMHAAGGRRLATAAPARLRRTRLPGRPGRPSPSTPTRRRCSNYGAPAASDKHCSPRTV
jgi:hypothetical protein